METLDNLQYKTTNELITIVNSLINSVDNLEQKIKQRDVFINALQESLALAKHRHYGKKSEKSTDDPQLTLDFVFDEAVEPNNKKEIESSDESITVPEHHRKKPGRKPLPKNLPRKRVTHDLQEDEKICGCGCLLTKIGEETSEQLDIIPAKVVVIENVKYKYACKKCECTIKTAKMPAQPIPKSIATPGTISYVATSKFCDGLPLYRQEKIFQRMNVDIVRNTLSHWIIKAAELLKPLYQCLLYEITSYDIAYSDETRLQVLREPGRSAESKSFMWCFIGGSPEKKSVIYHYNPSRAHTVLEELLDGFAGYLHCDGYGAYDAFAVDHAVIILGCWMHCRRKFYEIAKVIKSEGLAHKAVKIIASLYKIEKDIKKLELSPEQIKEYRLKYSKPILDKFRELVIQNKGKILPKSPLGQAFTYADNQWPTLIRYLEDGRLEIDNGATERAIKPFVIGRKNFLFCNSVAGARAAEIIYSLIETCKTHKVEPYAYLKEVLTKLPAMTTLEQVDSLLPFNIKLE